MNVPTPLSSSGTLPLSSSGIFSSVILGLDPRIQRTKSAHDVFLFSGYPIRSGMTPEWDFKMYALTIRIALTADSVKIAIGDFFCLPTITCVCVCVCVCVENQRFLHFLTLKITHFFWHFLSFFFSHSTQIFSPCQEIYSFFPFADFNCPQAAIMSSPRLRRIGAAK